MIAAALVLLGSASAQLRDGCLHNCSNAGLCVYDQCVCQPGFVGAWCQNKTKAYTRCGSSTTFCPSISQCCFSEYSPSSIGCHASQDFGKNVSQGCGDRQPENQCCKPGVSEPMSTVLPNCIILGDSVSIGYTPDVTKLLAKECKVQHAPWDVRDGGAGSTGSGVVCLDTYLRTQAGVPYRADAILFNFGLHDMTSGARCESVYMSQLTNITLRLQATGSKLGFLTTTPYMPKRTLNNTVVEDMNALANASCVEKRIPVFDLYQTATDHCGAVYKDCDICRAHPCSFHYNAKGEALQAQVVADAFRTLLKK